MTLPTAIRERIERCSSLPTLPAVAIRVLELCQQEQLDLNQIGNTISSDPALAVKLMRTANSPIFGLRREVTSIPYAVSLLGLNAIRTLVLSFSLTKACQTGNRPGLKDYWRRSLLAALAARELCEGPNVGMREEAFLSGLLQDIGMLALAQALGQQYAKLLKGAKRDHDNLVVLEREAFGGDHALVGAWLLERWRMPATLAKIVAGSHEPPQEAGSEQERFLANVVALSGRFADQWICTKEAATRLVAEVERCRAAGLAVDAEAVNTRLVEQAPIMAPMFDVKLDAAEMTATLEQAQEVLLALSVRTSQELTGIHQALERLESRTASLLAETQQDRLTGVANRSHTSAYLEEVYAAAVNSNRLIGVIFADIDHFKSVNDTHGHSAGDAVLQSVAETISRSLRGGDFVGRWGGEEFVVVMRTDTPADLATVAERIRVNVATSQHGIGAGQTLAITISLGCAILNTKRHTRATDLVEEADRALYHAKRAGRNQFRMEYAAA